MDLFFQLALAFGGIFTALLWLGARVASGKVRGCEGAGTGRRREPRFRPRGKMEFRAKLDWEGLPGGAQFARGVNFHESGALVIGKRPVPPGTLVFAHFGTFNMAGFAYVRHCNKQRFRYAIGLEFRGALLREHMSGWNLHHTPNKWNDGVIG